MGILKEFTDEELKRELERRSNIRLNKPTQFDIPDLNPLRTILQEYIDEATENNYVSEDFEQYIFETVMNVFYGVDVWDYINEVLE